SRRCARFARQRQELAVGAACDIGTCRCVIEHHRERPCDITAVVLTREVAGHGAGKQRERGRREGVGGLSSQGHQGGCSDAGRKLMKSHFSLLLYSGCRWGWTTA